MSDNSKKVEKATLWDWVKAICTLVAVGVICYKVYLTPIELTVDFPTFPAPPPLRPGGGT